MGPIDGLWFVWHSAGVSDSPPLRPSYDELAALVERQAKQIEDQATQINELSGTVAALTVEITELRRR